MNGENQVIQIIKDTCQEGYIEQKDYDLLVNLSERYDVSKQRLDELIDKELEKVKEDQLERLFNLLQQPIPALSKELKSAKVANAFFPDLLNIGKLKLNINDDIKTDAFLPTSDIKGVTYVYDKDSDLPFFSLQNIAIRILLSVPVGKCHLTIIDENSGQSFLSLSGLDSDIHTIIDDAKELETNLIKLQKTTSSFIFKEIGNKYKDFNEYLLKNKKEDVCFNVFLVSGQSCFTADGINALKKLFSNADKAGLFFLFAFDKNELENNLELKESVKSNTFVCDLSTEISSSPNKELNKWFNQIYIYFVCEKALFN
ncbi:MAG: hypothetical protein KGV46_03185, partial [Pasteurella sp.]|nr:hypothetical protein [Pasteurella sp.]